MNKLLPAIRFASRFTSAAAAAIWWCEQKILWFDPECAERDRQQRGQNRTACAILAEVAAARKIGTGKMSGDLGRERVENRLVVFLEVFTLHQYQEVVATDMGDKVARGVAVLFQNSGSALDDLVAFAAAIDVVERLEKIQVHIAGTEARAISSRRSICSLMGTLPGKSVNGLA